MSPRQRKLGFLTLLYFCQGLPGGFLAVALPVILLRQGASLRTVGFAGLLSLVLIRGLPESTRTPMTVEA